LSTDFARVSLVMPVFNEAADLADVLASLAAQTYPHHALSLIIVDGGSTDGSADIVRDWLPSTDISTTLLHNARRTIPTSLNVGINAAPIGNTIVRLDAHTTYEPHYVAKIVNGFSSLPQGVACIGGPQIPMHEQQFGRGLVAALHTNPMGLGGAEFRTVTEPRSARGVYLGAWRAGILQSLCGFDEDWEANEDAELAARLRRAGYMTYLIGARSEYRVKRGPLGALRQWGKYGYWRARTLRCHPQERRLRHLVPPLALIAALAMLATPARLGILPIYALYCAAIFAKRATAEPVNVTLASCVFFPACQVAWTFGLFRGLLLSNPRRRVASPSEVLT
jgi:succinoglycan biosynthesis protein ExoA